MADNLNTMAKAAGLSLALGALTGQQPASRVTPAGKVILYWKPEQIPAVKAYVAEISRKTAAGGSISVDFLPVVLPQVVKYGLPIVLGLILTGYVLRSLK